jgi:glutaconate CoA-transferase subunit A
VIDNPCADDRDPIVLVPAIQPDVALFHAAMADRLGNVWIGVRREVMTMAHAARIALATVETIVDGNLLDDPLRAPGTLPALYVGGVALCPGGAKPLAFADLYPADGDQIRDYARAARTDAGFRDYLIRQGMIKPAAAE